MIVIKNSQLQSSIILTFGEPLHSYVLCEGKEKVKKYDLIDASRKRIQSLAV
jgi:hypothetical protein